MSLKAIELQVALPRTQNAGKIQDQLQQRGQVAQNQIVSEQQKDDDKNRKQVTDLSESEKKRLNNDDESKNGANSGKEKEKQRNQGEQNDCSPPFAKHPYKGNYVDFSG